MKSNYQIEQDMIKKKADEMLQLMVGDRRKGDRATFTKQLHKGIDSAMDFSITVFIYVTLVWCVYCW